MSIEWEGNNVLVCGGAGMIGSHLAKRLCSLGANVTIADNLSGGSKQNVKEILDTYKDNAKFEFADLRTAATCKRVVEGKDVVFQLAAFMGGIATITSIHADIMRDNVFINFNMLDEARKAGVKKYFYSSSACCYSSLKQSSADVIPLKEEDAYPAMPDEAYGWEKLFSELYCEYLMQDYGKAMDIKIGRFHNCYGSGYTAFDKLKGKAPCHLIIKAIKYPEQPFVIWGDGKQTRSFIYIEDCLDAVFKLMDTDFNKPINIGTDHLVTIQELADIIAEISGKEIEFEYDLTKPQGVRGRNASLDLCEKILGWRPKVDLGEGLKQVYWWAVENYDRLENI